MSRSGHTPIWSYPDQRAKLTLNVADIRNFSIHVSLLLLSVTTYSKSFSPSDARVVWMDVGNASDDAMFASSFWSLSLSPAITTGSAVPSPITCTCKYHHHLVQQTLVGNHQRCRQKYDLLVLVVNTSSHSAIEKVEVCDKAFDCNHRENDTEVVWPTEGNKHLWKLLRWQQV